MGKAQRKRSREESEKEVAAAPIEEVALQAVEEEEDVNEESETLTGSMQLQRATAAKKPTNRQKCLVFGSRNMTRKDRHLINDLRGLMPHGREHGKMGATDKFGDDVVELCSLHHCNSAMFIEAHRHDLSYLWLAQSPMGPSVKFQVNNIHTADELRMAGNCLKFSRPLLHFDAEFEQLPHLRVMKSLLQMTFNVPRYHPKSKPFVDHVLSFHWLDSHIWFRHYQIVDQQSMSLMEIGPRFTLEPVAILNGCCKGNVLWKNGERMNPTEQRRSRKLRQMQKAKENLYVQEKSQKHKEQYPQPEDSPLDTVFK